MGQFSVEISALPGSILNGNQHYIASQRHEGWKLIPTHYDDGGLSGGTLERPALQQLLEDIAGGTVDLVVVYKIDRLTRSLADFARLVDRFDAAECSFVSVTQSFNTSTSMGRLTLNVLLSFAQFEREVTAERIRDKIAASKKKGYWMGGLLPLGYDKHPDPKMRTLVINEAEAETVKEIFQLYEKHGCLRQVEQEVVRRGYRSKKRAFADGRTTGSQPLRRGQINFILRNPVYLGRIRHKTETYEGLHNAIIDQEAWDAVQSKLDQKSPKKSRSPSKSGALLTGRIFDETGDFLTPTHSQKGNRRYRYYVSGRLLAGSQPDPSGWRLPAKQLEDVVGRTVLQHIEGSTSRLLARPSAAQMENLRTRLAALSANAAFDFVERVQVNPGELNIKLSAEAMSDCLNIPDAGLDSTQLELTARFRIRRRCGETKLVFGASSSAPDLKLIRMVALAHSWLDEVKSGTCIKDIAERYGWPSLMVRERIRLAFLSPGIVQAILEGRQPDGLTLTQLVKSDIPLDWDQQWTEFGFGDTD
ncbi:recombinase family protein [Hyphomonas sp.]|uniref:recombinase family protein n=1 Tax=Hyphomonas sp. TaxID=87 RepID=UPI0025C4C2C7|nr:recombinase family protein [Hyphomonas sp.]